MEDLEILLVVDLVEVDELIASSLLELMDIDSLDVAFVVTVRRDVTVLVVVLVTVEMQDDEEENLEVDVCWLDDLVEILVCDEADIEEVFVVLVLEVLVDEVGWRVVDSSELVERMDD